MIISYVNFKKVCHYIRNRDFKAVKKAVSLFVHVSCQAVSDLHKSKICKKIQDESITAFNKSVKKLIVYLVPPHEDVNGGIKSIYNMCTTTRMLLNQNDTVVILATLPSRYTYFENRCFSNSENVFRFNQLFDYFTDAESVYIHIPEYAIADFLLKISDDDLNHLSAYPHLTINVMNQNHLIMPELNVLDSLKSKFRTADITQTTAFSRDCSQEKADYYNMPVHRFGTYDPKIQYHIKHCSDKQKIIVLSPDMCPFLGDDGPATVSKIRKKLSHELPEYQQVVVHDMKYEDYLTLISDAKYAITFGEGFDGYLSEPISSGSISFSVYNDVFFPNEKWLMFENIFESYDEMYCSIIEKIRCLDANPDIYDELNKQIVNLYDKDVHLTKEMYENNFVRYYQGKYDYIPNTNK